MRQIKNKLVEFLKYDYNQFKMPLVLMARLTAYVLLKMNRPSKAFEMASNIYRTGWSGSYEFGLKYALHFFKKHPNQGKVIVDDFLKNTKPLDHTKKFFEDPSLMLDGIITVLKNPTKSEKGALIINYSYYFPLFIYFFDVEKISKKFHIILEPSWAGFCELNILSFTLFDFPVFLQTYEKRDKQLFSDLETNIVTIDVGPSWFIDHNKFDNENKLKDRDIDIIMVAAWAEFKRHKAFFKAIKPYVDRNPNLKIVLVGYPVDLQKKDIIAFAIDTGVVDNITIYEWITPKEVAKLQSRAKLNVLWSKFEGNNRAIIEGMFANVPVVMRKGHNYGEHYDFINQQTGMFADEKNLSAKVELIMNNYAQYSPRDYVMNNRNCIEGTKIIGIAIENWESENGSRWTPDLAVKINDLHGMTYLERSSSEFYESYQWLQDNIFSSLE